MLNWINMEIEINGIKYKERPPVKQTKAQQVAAANIVAIAAMVGMNFGVSQSLGAKGTMRFNNIIKEYGLIQQKTSTLSRSERAYIVHEFERNFIKVEQ